jgi:hypothetical protein
MHSIDLFKKECAYYVGVSQPHEAMLRVMLSHKRIERDATGGTKAKLVAFLSHITILGR